MNKWAAKTRKRIIVFGAGKTSRKAVPKLMKDYDIVGIADNDDAKWGQYINGVEIHSSKDLAMLNFDSIVIVSIYWRDILKQLYEEKNIDECEVYFQEDNGFSLKTAYTGTFYKNIFDGTKNENDIKFCEKRPLRSIKNILFLAYYFPPMGASPIQRTLKFVKYLSQMGYSITVMTTDSTINSMDYSLVEEVPETVKVIRISNPSVDKIFTPIEERKRIFNFISSFSNEPDFFNEWMNAEESQGIYILPDQLIQWAVKCFSEIDNYINMDSIDAIYSTVPHWSQHLLGYALKRKYGIPWVADYRDPWLSDDLYANIAYSFMTEEEKLWYRRLEGILTPEMDRIIVAGEAWLKAFIDTYAVNKEKIECITNGYDEEDFKDIVRSDIGNDAFTLCYNGVLGYNRKPQYLLEVISELIDDGIIKPEKIRWIFNGDIGYLYKKMIEPYDRYGIVIRNDFLSHKDSLRVAINSDLMIMYGEIGNMATITYPGKFYEYLRLGLPILCFSGKGSPQERMLEETGLGVNIQLEDKESIRQYIISKYDMWKKNGRQMCMSKGIVEKYNRKNLTKKLAEVFENLR